MSLINDALKRAREKQRNLPPSGAEPLPPVESPPSGGAGWILAVAAILFLAAVCLFFGSSIFGNKVPPPAPAKVLEVSTPPPVVAASAPAPVTKPPVTNTNTNPPPAAIVEPLPKVQGIIFNTAHPLAIVNGQTVNAGDRVGNFLVKQILKTSVVIQCPDGTQKSLGMGE